MFLLLQLQVHTVVLQIQIKDHQSLENRSGLRWVYWLLETIAHLIAIQRSYASGAKSVQSLIRKVTVR
jgi:hypothetical protein